MTTKHFCFRCEVEIGNPVWLVGHGKTGFLGERRIVCKDCKESFKDWLMEVKMKTTITDKQIRKVLDLTSFAFMGPLIENRASIHRKGMDTDLGLEADLVNEVRRILETSFGPIQTPQEELVDVPVVRTVRDEGKSSSISGEENPS